jgi:cobalt/nickel transport system permease protein
VLRRFRMPAILITTIALMYRYLYVLIDESSRMRRARASRTFTKSRSRAWHDLANLVGQLFLRTADRADRIYAAMCSRGWQ